MRRFFFTNWDRRTPLHKKKKDPLKQEVFSINGSGGRMVEDREQVFATPYKSYPVFTLKMPA
jgi:hypothetical protein